ncbi:MAG: NUDIX domain-containing protein [Leptospiraceae bacterium]|nr:NUDIX domain-containing protein [Leptospiraceae bacterium]
MSLYVAGIDVGGEKKGYHICLLRDRRVEVLAHSRSASESILILSNHLKHRKASLKCLAIDGPARARRFQESIRRPEAELASRGYRMLYTPREAPATDHWMQRSATIHGLARKAFPGCSVLETYPTAISDRLFGLDVQVPISILQGKEKRKFHGDYIDSILCAMAAHYHCLQQSEELANTGRDARHHVDLTLPQFPLTRATLAFLIEGKRVLLGLKKKGFGKGYWNGFGGKIEAGETPVGAAVREIQEECGLKASNLRPAGRLFFHFDDDPRRIEGFLFRSYDFSGHPVETPEMRPRWFSIRELPFDKMWEDDRFWLPHVLQGKEVYATFRFAQKKMVDYSLEIRPGPGHPAAKD